MREEIIQSILNDPRKPFGRECDLTADERIAIREVMTENGMGMNTLYQRMMYIGFDEWEVKGVERCVDEFETGGLEKPKDLANLWSWLVENGLHPKFVKYMSVMGMSRHPVGRRFAEMNFKPWELEGFERMLRKSGEWLVEQQCLAEEERQITTPSNT